MIRLELIDIVKEQFPALDIATKDGIIKLSKIIKAEIKLNDGISAQDVEDLVNFLSVHGNKFNALTGHKNIAVILRGEGERITFSPFKDKEVAAETIYEFQAVFSENISKYIKQSIALNNWNNLKSLFIVYPFIVAETVKLDTLEALHLKNQALSLALRNGEHAPFAEQHPYATDGGYFSMLSAIDNLYFDADLRDINNSAAGCHKNMVEIAVLGNIIYALTFYNAYDDALNMILGANKKTAYFMMNIHQKTSVHRQNRMAETVLFILLFLLVGVLALTIGSHIPRGVYIVVILVVKIIFLVSKK